MAVWFVLAINHSNGPYLRVLAPGHTFLEHWNFSRRGSIPTFISCAASPAMVYHHQQNHKCFAQKSKFYAHQCNTIVDVLQLYCIFTSQGQHLKKSLTRIQCHVFQTATYRLLPCEDREDWKGTDSLAARYIKGFTRKHACTGIHYIA